MFPLFLSYYNLSEASYSRLKGIVEPDNVRMIHPLQHLQFIVDHLLVPFDILLQYDLDGVFLIPAFCFPHDAISSGA